MLCIATTAFVCSLSKIGSNEWCHARYYYGPTFDYAGYTSGRARGGREHFYHHAGSRREVRRYEGDEYGGGRYDYRRGWGF